MCSLQVLIIKISHITGLLLNFKSFTSFSYKITLIKCLIDRLFKICNNWNSFDNDMENKFFSNQNPIKDTCDVYYFKLSYTSNLLHDIKNKLSKLCK